MAIASLNISLFPTYSMTSIGFADISVYPNQPSNPSFQVVLPQGYGSVNLLFTPSQVNIFNNTHLGLDCEDNTPLPDGLYKVTYSVTPNQTTAINRTFFRTALFDCKAQRAFLMIENSCDCSLSYREDQKQLIRSAMLLRDGAIAAASNYDEAMANKMYKKASDIIERITTCNC